MGDNIFNLPLTSQEVSDQDASLISQIFKPKPQIQQQSSYQQPHPHMNIHPQQSHLHPHMSMNGVSPIQKVFTKENSITDKLKDYGIILIAFVIISLPVIDKMLNKLTDNNIYYNLVAKVVLFMGCLILIRSKN